MPKQYWPNFYVSIGFFDELDESLIVRYSRGRWLAVLTKAFEYCTKIVYVF